MLTTPYVISSLYFNFQPSSYPPRKSLYLFHNLKISLSKPSSPNLATMADPSLYTYASPLAPYAGLALPPLPNEISEDGKSYVNPPAEKASDSYEAFTAPLDRGRRGGL
jgi:hypothetical protein